MCELLQPGAHFVAIGGHRTGMLARRAGFEIRDSIFTVTPMGGVTHWLLRKPCSEATVAAQVLKTGTGAINIAACRVGSGSAPEPNARLHKQGQRSPGFEGGFDTMDRSWVGASGRWPSNLVLIHGVGCVQEGTKRVKPGNGSGRASSGGDADNMGYQGGWAEKRGGGVVENDGTETVPAWSCEPGCPVAALDVQSGDLKAGVAVRHAGVKEGTMGRLGRVAPGTPDLGYADMGGASRFFPQFPDRGALDKWFERLVGGT